jgi:hypothetical protein
MPLPFDTISNSDKYRFADFTIARYGQLIELARSQGFVFVAFGDVFPPAGKIILWRHDVEFSPHTALRMAEIESDAGVKATYFFQLHSEFYNVLEKEVSHIVARIKELGHDIGLHFDSHYFNVQSEDQLANYLILDAEYFNRIFGMQIRVFSFHNTTPFILSCERSEYAGFINVYSREFKKLFAYCADSTGFWRYERLEEVLQNPKVNRLQVLTHDAMWSETVLSPRQRVFKAIDEHAQRIKKCYDAILKHHNAKNIDWQGEV